MPLPKKNKYAPQIDAEIDLHGMTRAAAHETVEKFLDTHAGRLRIVTGKGTGAVRDEVRQLLLDHRIKFETAKFNEGGSGAFVVNL